MQGTPLTSEVVWAADIPNTVYICTMYMYMPTAILHCSSSLMDTTLVHWLMLWLRLSHPNSPYLPHPLGESCPPFTGCRQFTVFFLCSSIDFAKMPTAALSPEAQVRILNLIRVQLVVVLSVPENVHGGLIETTLPCLYPSLCCLQRGFRSW